MPEPLVVSITRQFRLDLLAAETVQMQEMAGRWLIIERTLSEQIDLLANDLATEKAAGRAISQAKLYRMERYQALMSQLQREVQRYAEWSEGLISSRQTELVSLGAQQAATAITASMPSNFVGAFNVLNVDAIEAMAALVSERSPLTKLLKQSWPDAAEGLSNALLRGTALGWGPTKTAAEMRKGMSWGLNRSLNIARTEQLRALRMASSAQYRESGVLSGYKRICARDSRVCAGCLAADGRVYPVEHVFDSHPQCRCSSIPLVAGLPPVKWQSSSAWLREQDAQTQRQVLGQGRYDLWKNGQVQLSDMAKTVHDPEWGGAIVPRTVGELRQRMAA
jgi:SPP1 gp7 family putative phage head morphogenesis protein